MDDRSRIVLVCPGKGATTIGHLVGVVSVLNPFPFPFLSLIAASCLLWRWAEHTHTPESLAAQSIALPVLFLLYLPGKAFSESKNYAKIAWK